MTYLIRRPVLICLFGSLFYFYEYIQMNIFNVLAISISENFGIEASTLGILSSSYFFGNAGMLLIAGILLDKYSARTLMLFALSICIFGLTLFSHTHSLTIAIVGRTMMGVGNAFCYLSCMKLAALWYSKKYFGLIIALMGVFAMLGGITSQLPTELLFQHYGYHKLLQLDISLGIVFWILLTVFVWEPKVKQKIKKFYNASFKSILLNPINWLFGIIAALLCSPIFIFTALWGKLYLIQIHQLTPKHATIVSSMIFVGHIVGSPLFGWLSNRRDKMKILSFACFTSLLTVLIIIYQHNLSVFSLLVLFFILGFSNSSQIISYPVIRETNNTNLANSALGFLATLVILIGALLQVIFSALIQAQHQPLSSNITTEHTNYIFTNALMLFPIAFIICGFLSILIPKIIVKNHDGKINYRKNASLFYNR